MNTRTVQLSFAGGEIAPELYGRPDAVQYRTGAAQLKNWVVKPQGPARTRPGLRHVATSTATAAPRLVPFIYSTGQSLVVEVSRNAAGQSVARFFTQGAALKWAVPFDLGDAPLAVDVANDAFVGREHHGYVSNTEVRMLVDKDGTDWPAGVSGSNTYFVGGTDEFTTRRFQLFSSSGPTGLVSLTSTGTGYLRTFKSADLPTTWATSRDYEAGQLVYWHGNSDPTKQAVYHCTTSHFSTGADPLAVDSARWHRQPDDGTLEIVLPATDALGTVGYAQADLSKLVWRQNGDVLTLANNTGTYPLVELIRGGATFWSAKQVALSAAIGAPFMSSITPERGVTHKFDVALGAGGATSAVLFVMPASAGTTTLPVTSGDLIYVVSVGSMAANYIPLLVDPATGAAPAGMSLEDRKFQAGQTYLVLSTIPATHEVLLGDLKGNEFRPGSSGSSIGTAGASWSYSSATADSTQEYKVTSIDDDNRESLASSPLSVDNILSVNGASNTLNIRSSQPGSRYRAYKKENGLFGYIGEAEVDGFTTQFVDDNIAPDLGRTPPILDTSITGTNYPAAVGGHEQRLFLASTETNRQTVWGSQTGNELDFTYTLPVQDTNRLKFTLDSNQAQTVRHIIGMRDLILLTLSGEFRVRAADDGALAPSTIFARQEGYDGANSAQPAAISNHVVYCAARGGHVRKLAYEARRAAFESLSVSLRAPHLFDDFTVLDFGVGKAPFPCVWACSSGGKLLGMTFVPEEQVEGWHQHETAGTFESITAVPEGDEDVLYAAVKRADSSGAAVYTIERLQEFSVSDIKQAACLDAHTTTYTTAGALYGAGARIDATDVSIGEIVTVTGRNTADTATQVAFDAQDVGREIHFTSADKTYRVLITGYTNSTVVTGTLLTELPPSLASVTFASGSWRFASSRIYVPAWLAGTACSVVADSEVKPAVTPVRDLKNPEWAYVDLSAPGLDVHVGLPYVCDLQTLPIAVQVEGLGTGREKNVDKAWLRLFEAAGLSVGPDADNLQPVTDAQDGTALATGETRTLVTGKWTEDGQILVRQAKPFPATVVSLAARVSFGD